MIIIAEAGVNHNGSLETAMRLVDVAADAGADYVKFQTFRAENLVIRSAARAEYQARNMGNGCESQYEMLRKFELSEDDHRSLMDYCEGRGIKFLSTAFDLESVGFLHSLGLELWKIPSGEITNYPLLRKIAGYDQEVVMSTGMCDMQDVEAAMRALEENGQDLRKVTLLHCNTQYPTPMCDVNLLAMNSLKRYSSRVGFSDHTSGIEVPVAAAALGASVIEKHFTLSRDLPGPDHKASLEPHELKAMVEAVRNVVVALGSSDKCITPSEAENRPVARKSIVAARKIRKGEIFSDENMTAKRPGTGISPMRWNEVTGKTASRDFEIDEPVEL